MNQDNWVLLGSSNAKLKEYGARYSDGREDYAAGDDTAEVTIWGRRLLNTSKSFDNLEHVHRDLSLKIEEVISYEQKRMDLHHRFCSPFGPASTIFNKHILQTRFTARLGPPPQYQHGPPPPPQAYGSPYGRPSSMQYQQQM
ncbi:hypothetical protein LTR17_000017 [Elasticomyces elasticus]|nr:hypothetical protein LTR17_000017 [Elasticomyces elasticus]